MSHRSRDNAAPVLRLVPTGKEASHPSSGRKLALDDVEILAAVGRGDASAACALHDRARPHVDRTIRRLLGRLDTDHQDLAQLAMIGLVQSIPRFRGECSLDTWIARVTAHTVFKELRRRKSERALIDASIDSETHASSVDFDRRIAMRDVLGRVRRHLDAIDPVKAWTVLLHDVCGYDLREIAEITEASVAAAQTRLVRGRRELHERIAADAELADVLEQMGVSR